MSEILNDVRAGASRRGDFALRNLAWLLILAVAAIAVMGYHPGLEDDSFYLAAIKKDLHPALFPHDAEFFRLQFQATIFDKLIAVSARIIPLPLAWTILLWQLAAILFLLHGCWRIGRRCFVRPEAQWSAVMLVAALLTLPLPGIAINLADQYLHPRTLATAAILAAIVAVFDRRYWRCGIWLAIAFAIHAIMASFGISFCLFLAWSLRVKATPRVPSVAFVAAFALPFGWIFEPSSDAWRQAAATRGFYFLARWHWYEWLGVFAPLILLFLSLRFLKARRQSSGSAMPALITSLLYYGIFQTIVGLLIMLPPGLERLRPFEPMRYLHLLYLLFFVIVGGFLGGYVLGRHLYRWVLLYVPLAAGMYFAQRQMYPASAHLEFPGRAPRNEWLQVFDWIRLNTPEDALFAIDPHYETLPGEDQHGFRALAERSVLADYEKDGGMAARVPRLAPRWLREVTALNGWRSFQLDDFQRLKREFGVNWIVVSDADAIVAGPTAASASAESSPPAPSSVEPGSITCPYQGRDLMVCRLY